MDEPISYISDRLAADAEEPLDLMEEVEYAVVGDDKNKFLSLIKGPEALEELRRHCLDAEIVFKYDAVNCATALLAGETEGVFNLRDILVDVGMTPLHLAALFGAPRITKLLLERGYCVDAKCDYEYQKLKLAAATPLDIGIEIIDSNGLLNYWTPQKSIFELLVVLCWIRRRKNMETVRLLIQNTQDKEYIQRKFIYYAEEGKLVQAGVLLMAAPELLLPSCLHLRNGWACSNMLYEILNFKDTRTEIEEGLALLLDAFAMIGDKLVAYIRLKLPDISELRQDATAMDLAYFLREAVYDNQAVRRADDYFLRFFKPVLLSEAEKGNFSDWVRCEQFGHKGQACVSILGFQLLRKNIKLGYINSVFPTLQPEDEVRLATAIEKKLASSSSLRRLSACIGTSEREEFTRKGKQLAPGFPFAASGTYWPIQPSFSLSQVIPRPSFRPSYSTMPGNKLMGQSKLKSLFSTMNVGVTSIISVAKRLIK